MNPKRRTLFVSCCVIESYWLLGTSSPWQSNIIRDSEWQRFEQGWCLVTNGWWSGTESEYGGPPPALLLFVYYLLFIIWQRQGHWETSTLNSSPFILARHHDKLLIMPDNPIHCSCTTMIDVWASPYDLGCQSFQFKIHNLETLPVMPSNFSVAIGNVTFFLAGQQV